MGARRRHLEPGGRTSSASSAPRGRGGEARKKVASGAGAGGASSGQRRGAGARAGDGGRPRAASDETRREEAAAPAPGRLGRRLRSGRRGRRAGGAGGEGGVLAIATVAGRQHGGAGRRLQALHAQQHGVHELGSGALELPLQPQASVLPAHPAQQGRLRLLLVPGARARPPGARRPPRAPPAPARRAQEEAPRSSGRRGQPELAPRRRLRHRRRRRSRAARVLLRGPHPGGDLEGGHPDVDELPDHPRWRRRVGRAQPGGGAAQGAPSAPSGPGARGEAAPVPGAPGVTRAVAPPAGRRPSERASDRATERTLALERTLVSRMFTEPAPLVHFTREQSPPPPDAARRGGPRTSGQVRPRARPRLPGTAGLAAQDPLLPSPPDGDVSRTGGTPANPPSRTLPHRPGSSPKT